MEIKRTATAGTLESNDVLVTIAPNSPNGVRVELTSIVGKLYGDAIVDMVEKHIAGFGVTDAKVLLQDRGALDCAIKARVETAILRAEKEEE